MYVCSSFTGTLLSPSGSFSAIRIHIHTALVYTYRQSRYSAEPPICMISGLSRIRGEGGGGGETRIRFLLWMFSGKFFGQLWVHALKIVRVNYMEDVQVGIA